MVTLLAERAQECGIDALVPDLTGTGDSTGELRDATMDIWRGDLRTCVRWLLERGVETLDMLAIRFGALLLGQFEPDVPVTSGHLVLWQPVASGRQLVNQFIRLRFAAGLIEGGDTVDSSSLRETMRREGSLEIAGYELSNDLACALEALELRVQPAHRFGRVAWFEVAAEESPDVGPAATRILSAWRTAGTRVGGRTLRGDPFWATTEISTVPALIDATLAALDDPAVAE
jgi:exosortase A-associated hydrolase 2